MGAMPVMDRGLGANSDCAECADVMYPAAEACWDDAAAELCCESGSAGFDPPRLTGFSSGVVIEGPHMLDGDWLYFEMIFLRAGPRSFYRNTLTAFSMLRGFGLPKPMI